ncbi:MAG: nucleotidyltransferase domain-containing protein [Nanoarchaeota archaeon]|nr:nucleotidyltransferase domain-containing protein [Nanoarchaeota archaeon]
MKPVKPEVKKKLENIEKEKGVTVLFAVETGSRLWRMKSKDSDYDVRFVYKRPLKDYLKIHKQPDVIDLTEGNFDYVGFDVYKFTELILKSNPSLIEWLESDLIYFDDGNTKELFRKFVEKHFNPVALYHHYKSMCRQNYIKYLKSGENMTHKKYLYAMRGLINAKWVARFGTVPPINFNKSIDSVDGVPSDVIGKLKEVIEIKKEGMESVKISRIHLFESYIELFLREDDEVQSRKIIDYSELQEYLFNIMGVMKH